jgi:SAM-dependent methyltransferase
MKHRLHQVDVESLSKWSKPLPSKCLIVRDDEILRLCKNRKVIHLGAADAPFHKEKARVGNLLHQKVKTVATQVFGIDLNEEAVNYLRTEHGITDITVGDACQLDMKHSYEVILCCDIIEHVSNPGLLLDSCRRCMKSDGVLVLTTANATALKLAFRALQGREAVHYDHVAWYSFATIGNVLLQHGFLPLDVGFFCYPTITALARFLFGSCARIRPATADGILMTAKPASVQDENNLSKPIQMNNGNDRLSADT